MNREVATMHVSGCTQIRSIHLNTLLSTSLICTQSFGFYHDTKNETKKHSDTRTVVYYKQTDGSSNEFGQLIKSVNLLRQKAACEQTANMAHGALSARVAIEGIEESDEALAQVMLAAEERSQCIATFMYPITTDITSDITAKIQCDSLIVDISEPDTCLYAF